jgi:hypothetical protein
MAPRHLWSRCSCLFAAFLTLAFVIAISGQVALPNPDTTNTTGLASSTPRPTPQPLPQTGRLTHDFSKDPDAYVVVNPSGTDAHMLIKFEHPKSQKLIASMFIRAGAPYSVSNQMVLPGDHYVVKVATGMNWFGLTNAFGPDGTYRIMRPNVRIEPYTRYYLHLKTSPTSALRQERLRWGEF